MSHDITSSTWWNDLGATPPEAALFAMPGKGEYHDPCNNPACDNTGADWYNRGSSMYYCDACARQINEQCLATGTRKACELHA